MLGHLRIFLWPSICADSLSLWIFQWYSFSMISTWSHRGQWSPFSLHMWSAMPDFSTSPCVTAFWCSWSLTLRGQSVSPLYFLPQMHGIAYIQSLVMLSSKEGLNRVRYLWSVFKLSKVVLMLYGSQILCIFSDNPFTWGRQTVFWVLFSSFFSCIHLSQFWGAAAMYPGYLLHCRVLLILTNSLSNVSGSPLMTFAWCFKQGTIPFFTLYGWWELKLRYCPGNVGLRYTDVLNPCSVQDIRTSRDGSVLLLSFSIVNCIKGLT